MARTKNPSSLKERGQQLSNSLAAGTEGGVLFFGGYLLSCFEHPGNYSNF